MNGDRSAKPVCRFNRHAHLDVRERLDAGHVRIRPGGAVHLDPIGTGVYLRANGVLDLTRIADPTTRHLGQAPGAAPS